MMKTTFVPMAIPTQLTRVVSKILDSTESHLPIKYLGLLLTIRKPRQILFQPMLEELRRRIEGWASGLLTFGGRVTLVKAILSAIPLYYMQALRMSKGIIRHIDRMRRSFLWKGTVVCKSINCLVNWERTCALKANGGLGVLELSHQNEALLVKWSIRHRPEAQWAQTLRHMYNITRPKNISNSGDCSFFLKEISYLLRFFRCSTGQVGEIWR